MMKSFVKHLKLKVMDKKRAKLTASDSIDTAASFEAMTKEAMTKWAAEKDSAFNVPKSLKRGKLIIFLTARTHVLWLPS